MREEKRDFNSWFGKLRNNISDYSYFVDFEKVYSNVNKIKPELFLMNSLIGSADIENEFDKLYSEYPQIIKCIPILLAVRNNEILVNDTEGEYIYNFKAMNYSIGQYKIFMRKTGLFDLIRNHIINNLYDYVTGVEVGLDSHGRKNRGGHCMENLVEEFIKRAGFVKGISYFKEIKISQVEDKWGLDLSTISYNGNTTKKFDFVVEQNGIVYAIETNFYNGKGSKLNETARSYKMIAEEAKNIKNFAFVWITDGMLGWKNARNSLKETFDFMDNLYNIDDLENGLFEKVFIENVEEENNLGA